VAQTLTDRALYYTAKQLWDTKSNIREGRKVGHWAPKTDA